MATWCCWDLNSESLNHSFLKYSAHSTVLLMCVHTAYVHMCVPGLCFTGLPKANSAPLLSFTHLQCVVLNIQNVTFVWVWADDCAVYAAFPKTHFQLQEILNSGHCYPGQTHIVICVIMFPFLWQNDRKPPLIIIKKYKNKNLLHMFWFILGFLTSTQGQNYTSKPIYLQHT